MRRTKYEVMFDILAVCHEPRKITHIMQKANLNCTTLKQIYLKQLLEARLLRVVTKRKKLHYLITERGLTFKNLMSEVFDYFEPRLS